MDKSAVYGRLLSYLKPYWKQLIIAYGSMFIATGLNLLVPQIIKEAIDNGLAAGNARGLQEPQSRAPVRALSSDHRSGSGGRG